MKRAGTADQKEHFSERQRAALVNLLADEDPGIYQQVKEKILACGPYATEWLRPHTLSSDPTLRRRAQEIIVHFKRQVADNQCLAFCLKNGEDFDLEQAGWLLAQSKYPEINIEAYQALVDHFARELRQRLDMRSPAKMILSEINEYLFGELGFSGNEENYYDPENTYLNRVIDRRTGNPINLCLFYLLIARRLRLPISGIGLPGRFICRYQSSSMETYLDVFAGGQILTKADCVQYLLNTNFTVRDDYLAPVSSRRWLLRICANLHQIYLHLGDSEETTRIQRYLVALTR
jgi:regulator of sirC expression with transglutaminase-like and TPR domain